MNESFFNIRARDVMTDVVATVSIHEKVEQAARLMAEHRINALPAVLDTGCCVGILSSQNIAEYESVRQALENDYQRGYFFDLARYGIAEASRLAKIRYDEVDYHLTREVVYGKPTSRLAVLAEKMWEAHSHHAVIVNDQDNVCGIVSSLDILRHAVVGRRRAV